MDHGLLPQNARSSRSRAMFGNYCRGAVYMKDARAAIGGLQSASPRCWATAVSTSGAEACLPAGSACASTRPR